jgi:hypothetical protein
MSPSSKKRILIQIFPLVRDIDLLQRSLLLLKQNSQHIDRDKFHIIIDVTLPLTTYLVDWDKSVLDREFFINKFLQLQPYADWADETYFNVDYELLGCVDYCINNIYKYEFDSAIWLEVDVLFNQVTLTSMLEASCLISETHDNYILTPEYVKLQDSSWDIVTNQRYLDRPANYHLTSDSVLDSHTNYGDLVIQPVMQDNQKAFKFGGGWFTLFSKNLLDSIEFPKNIKGYAPIDTFIMLMCYHIPNAIQYKLKNLVVCEDKKYVDNFYKDYVVSNDRKHDPELNSWNKLIQHGNTVIKTYKK